MTENSWCSKLEIVSPPLHLLVNCIRMTLGTSALSYTNQVREIMDWPKFICLAEYHGVAPFISQTLLHVQPNAAPTHVILTLQQRIQKQTIRNILMVRELARLMATFEDHGISAVPFKGPALAMQVYGNLGLRTFGDLDIWVQRQDFEAAGQLLIQKGYWTNGHIKYGEQQFGRRDGKVVVDLHRHLCAPPFAILLEEEAIWGRLQPVSLAGGLINTLSPEDHLLVLCLHGYKDCWWRLQRICDIAVLIQRFPTICWSLLVEQTDRRHSQRILLIGLSLAQQVCDMGLPNCIQDAIYADQAVPALTNRFRYYLLESQERPETKIFNRNLSQWILQFRCLTHLRHRKKYLRHRLRHATIPNQRDQICLPLPTYLYFLYRLFRPARLLWQYVLWPFA